jgi:8-oxo-dGTP pyrophosphatase MutT (NUDIX family)
MSHADRDPSKPLAPRPLRPAASVVLVRPGARGIEVLMLRRADKGDAFSDAWVFPGGIVDAADRAAHACCAGPEDPAASRRLDLPQGGLDFYVAAIRETFEEAGVLLGVDAAGNLPCEPDPALQTLLRRRHAIAAGAVDFAAECRALGLRLAADRLHYIAHWITPLGTPKRFDTRFFLAALPPGQGVAHDGRELTDHGWFSPSELIASREHKLLTATVSLLGVLDRFDSLEALLAWASSPLEVPPIMRRRCRDATGSTGVMPEHPAWPEIGLLDPSGAGDAWCELPAGHVTALAAGVLRRAGAGGNAYLVGDPATGWAAIDVGEDDAHWLASLGVRDAALLCTRDREGPRRVALGQRQLERLDAPGGASAWLLAGERLAFTGAWEPGVGDIPGADWAAPSTGFLRPLSGGRRASGQ